MDALMNSNSSTLELFQRFMNAYKSISSASSYSGSIEQVEDYESLLVIGSRVSSESPELYKRLKSASEKNSAKILYAHPLEDIAMQSVATQFMKYEPGAEEGVVALLAYYLLRDVELPEKTRTFLNDLDLGYLEAESNIGEEEFEDMIELFEGSKKKMLIVGSDIMAHSRVQNIAKLCALIEQNSDFSLLVVPDNKDTISTSTDSVVNADIEMVEALPEFNGTVIYNIGRDESGDKSLRGSAQFARAAKISDGDFVSVSFGGQTISRKFKVESELKGTIAINPTFDITVDPKRYKFERSQINKINQNSESNNE